ncbi:MAG TPA: hypothetical protein VFJ97_07695 [Dermatophilaceae bacterium]|nr:hypothetical protein [Dermatophilaceae bacterium]
MGGKHRSESGDVGPRPGRLVVVGVVVLLLLIGGVVIVSSLARDDTTSTAAPNLSATTSPGPTTSASPSTTTTTTTTTTGTPAQSGTGSVGSVAALLSGCRAQVAALDRLRVAGAASYRDWNLHVRAQLGLEDGSMTFSEAKSQWADSKSRSAADLAGYAKADAAAKAVGTGCRALAQADLASSPDAAAARSCVARAAGLAPLLAAARTVNGDWAEHVNMMAHKGDTPSALYSRRWLAMVRDAGPALASYRSAAARLSSVPACAG